jgi:hypothetical protein
MHKRATPLTPAPCACSCESPSAACPWGGRRHRRRARRAARTGWTSAPRPPPPAGATSSAAGSSWRVGGRVPLLLRATAGGGGHCVWCWLHGAGGHSQVSPGGAALAPAPTPSNKPPPPAAEALLDAARGRWPPSGALAPNPGCWWWRCDAGGPWLALLGGQLLHQEVLALLRDTGLLQRPGLRLALAQVKACIADAKVGKEYNIPPAIMTGGSVVQMRRNRKFEPAWCQGRMAVTPADNSVQAEPWQAAPQPGACIAACPEPSTFAGALRHSAAHVSPVANHHGRCL